MSRIFALIFLLLTGPVMADSYYCDSTVRATTLNVTWNECPRHRWSPYVKTSYDGQTMNGTFYGQGTYTWEDGSVYTGKWREGKAFNYFVFDTNADACGTTTTVISASDRYEVAADGSLILSVPADIEGLENCPLSAHPFDTVKFLFSADRVVQRIVKKAVKPSCAG